MAALVHRNRKVLKSVLKCLTLCARQGLALRGHRDDSTSEALNKRKFLAVVEFRRELDARLDEHLRSGPRNSTMISKTVQNDLMHFMGKFVARTITEEVAASPFVAVLADEVTDISNWEQLGVAVRYIKDNAAQEKLLVFSQVEQTDGKSICQVMQHELCELGIDLSRCRAQAYDGSGNMSGRLRGCQAIFREKYPLALYYHCVSHQLNLAITKASSIMEVHFAHETIKSVGLFFHFSPKRQRELERAIEEENTRRRGAEEPDIPLRKIGVLCETRWVERHTTLADFHVLYTPLLKCFDAVIHSGRYDGKAVTEANGLLIAIVSGKFLVAFHICRFMSRYLYDVSRLLQGTSKDIVVAYDEVKIVIDQLHDVRSKAEEEFHTLFSQMVEDHGEESFQVPRRCGRQTMRANTPGDSPEAYWRATIFTPRLDHMLAELLSRFSALNSKAIQGFHLLPSGSGNLAPDELSTELMPVYKNDLPSPDHLQTEMDRWQRKWKLVKEEGGMLPSTVPATLAECNSIAYPNIFVILQILLVIPVTTASVERANSSLKFVKTALRSSMTNTRLNALIRLFVHRDIDLDLDKIINDYARAHPRRTIRL